MNVLLRSASVLALATAALSAHALDAFNNLGPAPASYSTPNQGLVIDVRTSQGPQFTAMATGALTGFQIAMNNNDRNGPEAYALSLYADSGSNTLGSLLGTYSGMSTGVDYRTTTSALSSVAAPGAGVTIQSGAKYWLVASTAVSDGELAWNASLTGVGPRYLNGRYDTLNTPAFSVQVTPQPTPEPATFAALGLGALAMLRRRKRA